MCAVMSDSATPWTAAHQAPLSMGLLQARVLEWGATTFSETKWGECKYYSGIKRNEVMVIQAAT